MSIQSERHKSRRLALQALYQWQTTGAPINQIQHEFLDRHADLAFDHEYFKHLTADVVSDHDAINALFMTHSDRPIDEITPIERCLLQLATCELQTQKDIAAAIIIDEAIKLAKQFGADDSYKYINAILDKTAEHIRPCPM